MEFLLSWLGIFFIFAVFILGGAYLNQKELRKFWGNTLDALDMDWEGPNHK
jgi:hypothetical protein